MSERHPGDDALVALALDDAEEPERESLLAHLGGCPRCRGEYDAIAATVEGTLPAAPGMQPAAGFEERALAAMTAAGFTPRPAGPSAPPAAPSPRPSRRPTGRLLVAAAVTGLVVGSGATALVTASVDGPSGSAASAGAALVTRDGERVGAVTRATTARGPVLVVSVEHGRAGMGYRCRLRLADGSEVDGGRWTMRSEYATWVVDAPRGTVVEVDLLADSGRIWSSATL